MADEGRPNNRDGILVITEDTRSKAPATKDIQSIKKSGRREVTVVQPQIVFQHKESIVIGERPTQSDLLS